MALKLRVISEHYRELGENRSRVFGVNGGTVGRAPDNDWVLPDARRVVSGHHCVVQYHGGKFWLSDTSTNGVYVNDAEEPVAERPERPKRPRRKKAEPAKTDADRLLDSVLEALPEPKAPGQGRARRRVTTAALTGTPVQTPTED